IGSTPAKTISNISFPSNRYLSQAGQSIPYVEIVNKHIKLEYSKLDRKDVIWLMRTFPNVTSLLVAHSEPRSIRVCNHIVKLIKNWSPRLESLKLWLDYGNAKCVLSLLDALLVMPVLKHLTLSLQSSLAGSGLFSIDLPILARLHEFYFSVSQNVSLIHDSLDVYAQHNEQLNPIGLEFYLSSLSDELFKLNPRQIVELNTCRMS